MKDNTTYHEFLEVECLDFIDLLEHAHNLDVRQGIYFKPFDSPEDDSRSHLRDVLPENYPLGFSLLLRIPKGYLREKFHECKSRKKDYKFLGCIEQAAKEFFAGRYTDEEHINSVVFEEKPEAGNDFYEVSLRVEYSKIEDLLEDHPIIVG